MVDVVDYFGGEQWNLDYLYCLDGDVDGVEQGQINGVYQCDVQEGEVVVDIVFDLVVWVVGVVFVQGFLVDGFCLVEFGVFVEYFVNIQYLGVVGVFFCIIVGVVFVVDGGLGVGVLVGGQLQLEVEKVFEGWVQFQGLVGGIVVQVYGDVDNGYVGYCQGNKYQSLGVGGNQVIGEKI